MDKEKLVIKANQYLEYFQDSTKKLDENYQKCLDLEKILDAQIADITKQVPGRGTQHYLIDHITNDIALQSQKQSIVKDMSDLKKTALTYAIKELAGDDDSSGKDNVLAILSEYLKDHRDQPSATGNPPAESQQGQDLDKQIEERLKNQEKSGK